MTQTHHLFGPGPAARAAVQREDDSASHPSAAQLAAARRSGVTHWAGYLTSPAAAAPWPQSALQLVINEGVGLWPIYVAPLSSVGRNQLHPVAAAHNAHAQVARLHADRPVVVLDVERQAFDSDPHGCTEWSVRFFETLHNHPPAQRPFTAQYANAETLIHLHEATAAAGDEHGRPDAAWVAAWVSNRPSSLAHIPGLPDGMWRNRRAWQWHGNATFDGIGVDLSVCDDLPAMRKHAQPQRPPVLHVHENGHISAAHHPIELEAVGHAAELEIVIHDANRRTITTTSKITVRAKERA